LHFKVEPWRARLFYGENPTLCGSEDRAIFLQAVSLLFQGQPGFNFKVWLVLERYPVSSPLNAMFFSQLFRHRTMDTGSDGLFCLGPIIKIALALKYPKIERNAEVMIRLSTSSIRDNMSLPDWWNGATLFKELILFGESSVAANRYVFTTERGGERLRSLDKGREYWLRLLVKRGEVFG